MLHVHHLSDGVKCFDDGDYVNVFLPDVYACLDGVAEELGDGCGCMYYAGEYAAYGCHHYYVGFYFAVNE